MVGYDPSQDGTTFSDSLLSGAMGGMITRAIVSPLDVVKIRLQLQPDSKGSTPKYLSIKQTIRTIAHEEKIVAFWKGHVPAQCLSITYGSVQFAAFEKLTEYTHEFLPHTRDDTVTRATSHFLCGASASAFASVVAQPFDVLRTRLAAQKEPRLYKSLPSASIAMFKNEGVQSFYRGLVPTLTQIVPYSGLQFGSYSLTQGIWRKVNLPEGSVEHLVCGALAGIFSKSIVYPLDVIKKRLQVQGFGEATVSHVTEYNGFINCIRTVIKVEGALALYKGWSAAVLKSCATSGLVFFTYELFHGWARKKRNEFS